MNCKTKTRNCLFRRFRVLFLLYVSLAYSVFSPKKLCRIA